MPVVYTTDADGSWSSNQAIVGNQYTISYYNPYYQISKIEDIVISREGINLADVLATRVMDEFVTAADEFTYSVLNGTYCAIKAYKGTATEVVIPAEIDGYIVQKISNNAFKNNKTIEKVVFPEGVESVGSDVFYGCTALTYIGFNNKLGRINAV